MGAGRSGGVDLWLDGWGLSIVASIVTAHGGTITATARQQGGLDLLVVLPEAG